MEGAPQSCWGAGASRAPEVIEGVVPKCPIRLQVAFGKVRQCHRVTVSVSVSNSVAAVAVLVPVSEGGCWGLEGEQGTRQSAVGKSGAL